MLTVDSFKIYNRLQGHTIVFMDICLWVTKTNALIKSQNMPLGCRNAIMKYLETLTSKKN